MKVAVIGGTGLIGSRVVNVLDASGHEAVPHSPSTGLHLLSGKGLSEALSGADVVANLTDPPTSDGRTVRLPATRLQPMAAADVAQAVAAVWVGAPPRGTRNVVGPEVFTLDELGRITLAARGDQRSVVTDSTAGIYAAASGDDLIAKGDAVVARTTYRDWLTS
ncbi:hypothetical protein [Streptomyces sp. HGB0020]|uniref:hypothetical protein n=1 Tax=Streptomyces sp. HGB0020 TaxID=1078086 RepID=UPI00034EB737|nr:hypothetical protein [Streptomyces sp. HGB0020]EPD54399.1 hypothetical protein HMPREF1211_08521 [Streptomyces sp. HGB0020]EPD63518.1 hypothetical protein HMPREF1211_02645 [Streptomyces sp. HGB0020]